MSDLPDRSRERYFERREIVAALAFARAGGIAVHRNFDSYDGLRSPRGMVMRKPFLHVIGLRPVLAQWGAAFGLRPEWIQPEKRRGVAHYDVFGEFAEQLIDRLAAGPAREDRSGAGTGAGPRPAAAAAANSGTVVRSLNVLATGSIAFDYILTFKGRFRDHILPDQAHILNLSFLVDQFERRRGGVAANYAYNLALLGQPSGILGTAGSDGREYRDWLEQLGIDCSGLRILPEEVSATGFTTTDLDHNQITGYYGGAMNRAAEVGLADSRLEPAVVIIGPNAPMAMLRLVGECREAGIRHVFDPAHQLPHLSAESLEDGCRGAWIVIGNDYELELIRQRTGRGPAELLELAGMVVTTLGREGSRIDVPGRTYAIPAAPARVEVDPTGAGDAYRAGLVAGLLRGLEPEEAGRVASLTASYVVEQAGTIEHSFTMGDFADRYGEAFGRRLPAAFATS